jgi:hypothetical protein
MPNQDQWLGLVRAVLAMFSGYALAHGVNQDTWAAFVGFAGLGVNVVWSIAHHGLTIDLLTSFIRAGIGAAGGYAVQRGWATADNVTAISGVITMFIPTVWTMFVHRDPAAPPPAKH